MRNYNGIMDMDWDDVRDFVRELEWQGSIGGQIIDVKGGGLEFRFGCYGDGYPVVTWQGNGYRLNDEEPEPAGA